MSLPVVDDVVLGVVLKEVVVLVDVLEALTGLAVVAPQPTAAIESRKAMKKTETDIICCSDTRVNKDKAKKTIIGGGVHKVAE